jgi:hypothetical protein
MPKQVCTSAVMKCMFGAAPSNFIASQLTVLTSNQGAGVITDIVPGKNIPPFGMCNSPANPAFISATAAAMGTPTPVPCTYVPAGPWVPGVPNVLIGNIPAIDNNCKLGCALGGGAPVISITMPGQTTHDIP